MRAPVMVNDRRPGRSRRRPVQAGLLSAVAVLGSVGLGGAALAGPAGWQHRAQVTVRVELYVPPAATARPSPPAACGQRVTGRGGNPPGPGRGPAGRAGDDRPAAATGTANPPTSVPASGAGACPGAGVEAVAANRPGNGGGQRGGSGQGHRDGQGNRGGQGDGAGHGDSGDQVTTPHLVAGEAGADPAATAHIAAQPTPEPTAAPTTTPAAGKPTRTPTSKPKPTASEQDGPGSEEMPTPDASTEPAG